MLGAMKDGLENRGLWIKPFECKIENAKLKRGFPLASLFNFTFRIFN